MNKFSRVLAAVAMAGASMTAPVLTAPASAQVDNQDPGKFVDSLADTGFRVLRGNRATARGQFRSLLSQHFAVDRIGDQLIRSMRPKISQAQYAAYKAAFPEFIIGTYADRLYDYAQADLKVVRVQNQGAAAAVLTTVTKPGGRPSNVIWSLTKVGNGYKVANLTVGGVNLALSQEADFKSYAQRNGFDALVKFMKDRG